MRPSEEKEFETEGSLQELIAQHPELLAGDRMRPDDPLCWILVQREMPIEGWAVDLLLMDQHSYPTLVEIKRGDNREGRRSVVGQMLDYASAAAAAWSNDAMRVAFEQDALDRGADPDEELRALLGLAHDADMEIAANAFWERAAANLEAGRLRLLFVSDKIHSDLERSVTFWNAQTKPHIDMLAVEVKQYPSQSGDALVSRVIGQVDVPRESRGRTVRPPLTREGFLAQFPREVSNAITSLFDAAENAGATLIWATVSVAINARCSLQRNPVQVARFWPPSQEHMTDRAFSFYYWKGRETEYPPDLQETLDRYVGKFAQDDFTSPPPGRNDFGVSVKAEDLVQHVDLLTSRLCDTLLEISDL